MKVIRPGSRGEEVRDIQQRLVTLALRIGPDELSGEFGGSTEAAVRAFQQGRGLVADGMVGPDTWEALVEAGYRFGDRTLYLRYPTFRGDDVRALQRRLNALGFDTGREDGIFGERCDAAVREFQRNIGSDADGIVGPDTYQALERLRPPLEAPGRAEVRETAELREMTSSLDGAVIAIDPGHGPTDPGVSGPTGLEESRAAFALSEALARELRGRGAAPALLRGGDEDPQPQQRAREANEMGAAACISIHLNDGEPAAEGSSCMYYGTDAAFSVAGRRLAEVVQERLVSSLDLKDGRTYPMTISILRETRMPAIQVEPCFITNPAEERWLRDPAFVETVARAISDGLETFFETPAPRSEDG